MELRNLFRISCRCGLSQQVDGVDLTGAELIAEEHELKSWRRAYAHDTMVTPIHVGGN